MIGFEYSSMALPPRPNPPTSPPTTDRPFPATLAAAQRGDKAAQETLFEWFYPQVQAIVHRSLSRDLRSKRPWLTARFSTGDVVQEVFRSLLGDLAGFAGKTESAFVGYLAMVSRNRLLDAIRFHEASRRDGRRTLPADDKAPGEKLQKSPDAELATGEVATVLRELLAAFPERDQLLLRGRIEQDARFQDLAQQLGFPSEWAARRAFCAAKALLLIRFRQRQSK